MEEVRPEDLPLPRVWRFWYYRFASSDTAEVDCVQGDCAPVADVREMWRHINNFHGVENLMCGNANKTIDSVAYFVDGSTPRWGDACHQQGCTLTFKCSIATTIADSFWRTLLMDLLGGAAKTPAAGHVLGVRIVGRRGVSRIELWVDGKEHEPLLREWVADALHTDYDVEVERDYVYYVTSATERLERESRPARGRGRSMPPRGRRDGAQRFATPHEPARRVAAERGDVLPRSTRVVAC
jgi:hypothetical protein